MRKWYSRKYQRMAVARMETCQSIYSRSGGVTLAIQES